MWVHRTRELRDQPQPGYFHRCSVRRQDPGKYQTSRSNCIDLAIARSIQQDVVGLIFVLTVLTLGQ